MSDRPFILGVFGPPGSGKSIVGDMLREKGYALWDADLAVAELYASGGEGAKRVGEYFGRHLLDVRGGVLKDKLAKIVLQSEAKFRILEHLIHPLVVNHAQHWIDAQRRLAVPYLVLESAIFDSTGLGRFPDVLLRVSAPRSLCMARVLARGKTEAYFDFFFSRSRNYDTAFEIINDGNLRDLKKAFEKVLSQITMTAREKPTPS